MYLRPTLWQTCRVIANETRLQLLWLLFSKSEQTVSQIARATGMSQPNASNQLKNLRESGLVVSRRKKMEVFYRAEANQAIQFAGEIQSALRACYEKSVSPIPLIRHATAFTHERRIEILRALHEKPLKAMELKDKTEMSPSALGRHLEKLLARKYIKKTGRKYRLGNPGNLLGKTLMELAVR